MEASRDYRDNAYGMSMVNQFLKKRKDREAKEKAKSESDQEVNMNCSEHGCNAMEENASANTNRQNKNGAPGSSRTGGEKNEVLDAKEAEKWGKKIGQVKANAAPMKNLTKNQKKALEETRPSRVDMMKK